MLSSFINLQSLGLFLVLSCLFSISAFRFNFKLMQEHPVRLAWVFLISGFIVGFSDLILILQDREANILAEDSVTIAHHMGSILLAPFYGVLFAAVTWFSSGIKEAAPKS